MIQNKKNENTPAPSGKIKYGCLWGILIPFITFFASIGATILLLKDDYGNAHSMGDWALLAGKHILLFAGIIISVVIALFIGLWFSIKDSKPVETLRIFWPVLIILLYWIAPNLLPGPIDDSIVTLSVGIYQIYRYFKERNSSENTVPGTPEISTRNPE
ncbi:hypothetical protein LEP1GSC060_2436 [Leptospira weilii serovar Ranarum str. ICFT]|uniref:Uncharacterized protein n=1 Tax=Leptospira weilii serovar Ranarum str. ICFT TaxID=1218598 RepID=N1WQF3_9LEPT|nr:hypothetical protein LEP1GSC060_2436 [Leptospira weilii serovar Ranarum str. ICFT]